MCSRIVSGSPALRGQSAPHSRGTEMLSTPIYRLGETFQVKGHERQLKNFFVNFPVLWLLKKIIK